MLLSFRIWVKRVAITIFILVIALVSIGGIYEQVARSRVAKDFPAPGKLVDIGGREIHLNCEGNGTPLVVLEAGADTSGSALWQPVQEQVAQFTRVCSYDRAGIMWSDPAKGRRNSLAIAEDLHKALRAANEQAPYILVGASMGGPYVMTYTKYYEKEVAGMVLVDASHPEQTARLAQATGEPESNPIPIAFRALAAITWTGLPRLVLPDAEVPELPSQTAKAITAYQTTSLAAAFAEAAVFEDSLREAGTFRTLGNLPLAVLSRGKPWSAFSEAEQTAGGLTREQFNRAEAAWASMQAEEASWSSNSTHQVLADSSHVMQLERPDAVITAIKDIVGKARRADANP
ncbi:alpha/beta fold hydrolase [Paenibacillus eucommiae]|uniref:Pimeloyl-ACP methyl ester carboxylesterase n=1 Tax=Paenibacillus eucommiae TaxID=1355755 RepID=A0ABS4J998_9BACL|nr:alpha/beta hydrolase [Paenibacillus eucommiae]MBP1995836.1 pimeloyl-ACP methyl ester carboxylesterase [Paenibacillus eucommiae]